jgi:hypothetical protein
MKRAPYLHLLLLLLVLSCTRTEYKPFDEGDKPSVDLSRTVNFYLNPEFKDDPPECVVVYQPYSIRNREFVGLIESALIRHLSDKFPRVIGGRARDVKAANFAIDLTVPIDRKEFANLLNCGAFFEFRIFQPKHINLFIWSEIKLGLEARLFRQSDGEELWKAYHVAGRSDGGMSFSPFGLAVNAYDANAFSSDIDVVESVTEDLARRVITSLPDTKVLKN